MHVHLLDNYSHLDSPVHRVPAAVKLIAAVATVVALVTVPVSHVFFFAAVGFALLMLAAASQIPGAFLFKRMLLLEPLALGVAVLALLQPHGLHAFLTLLIRSTLCLATMIVVANTTPFSDALAVLRWARVPGLLVTTLALMHRYLFVLMEESSRMRRARASRTFITGKRRAWKSAANVAGWLFVRCTHRAERVHTAMCARGWR